MRLYVWEGDGISGAYHDDGTLVVLAETPEQAREIARASARPRSYEDGEPVGWYDRVGWDNEVDKDRDAAIEREPDRVIDLDTPCVIAFNGGGYD